MPVEISIPKQALLSVNFQYIPEKVVIDKERINNTLR